MKSRVVKVIAAVAFSLVLAGMASSYFLVKILMWVWPGFRDSVFRKASRGPYDLHSLILLSISTLLLLMAVYLFFGVPTTSSSGPASIRHCTDFSTAQATTLYLTRWPCPSCLPV